MRKHLIFIFVTICLVSCVNREVWRVAKNYPRIYTGIDTLIRIDGYYYHEDSIVGLNRPIIISNDGGFLRFSAGSMENHVEVQEYIERVRRLETGGSYTLSGDTIKARWADKYELASYHINSAKFIILNDSTLRRIWVVCETCDDNKPDKTRNDIYKFFQYPRATTILVPSSYPVSQPKQKNDEDL